MKRTRTRGPRLARWALAMAVIASVSLLTSCGYLLQGSDSDESAVSGGWEVTTDELKAEYGDGAVDSRDSVAVAP
jgi:hypothetical protein